MNTPNQSLKQLFLIIVISIHAFSASLAADLPIQVQRLAEQRQEAIRKIDTVFIKELEKIKINYTKAGDLENATLISELINQTKGGKDNKKFSPEGEWKCTHDGGVATIRVFKGSNVIIDAKGNLRPWVFENDGIRIHFYPNGWEKLVIDPQNPDIMKGTNAGGQKMMYTRIK